ncbi:MULTISPECIES: ABC transporter ATP-binding protein [Halococcus]|uniref:Probable branched-chain amino acid transport ATP-binding protein LivG n=1 Tax=Halococcus salifodinae DSM 8989 TaxID=1227456 RepID=M0N5P7_9EURY|nr:MULTISPECIES: ABC transporter ATP-binding protein [Halococcus]EMA53252.1 branched-chain amino acid ABC transporter ATP-binding protein [Halococcus salifodinae DSM 8989]
MSTDTPNETTDTDASTTTDHEGEALLRATDVTKTFDGLVALRDVSLDVRRGEIVGLIGPNGAGKTTLFNCISGVFAPTEGTVHLGDEEITNKSAHRVARSGLSRTFQITRPLEELSVLENVLVGAHIHTRRRGPAEDIAREQLSFVGLDERAAESAGDLTVGDQKRLELARTLATEPSILLLDEIMAGLTPTETQRMLDLFREIRESGTSILLIEHDMEAIMSVSDRVAVLDNGEAIAFDSPEAVASDERVIEAYIGGDVDADGDDGATSDATTTDGEQAGGDHDGDA